MTRRGLTREAVVASATAVVDAEGLDSLTLSRVATELDVRPPSLYNHVDGLDGLRRDVALAATEDLAARLGSAAMGRSGRDALRSIATAFRAYATEHPGLCELTAQARPDDAAYAAASMRAVEPVLAVLRGYDLAGDAAIHAARALRSAIHGFVTLELTGGFGLDVEVDASFEWLVDRMADALASAPVGVTPA